MSLRRRYDGAAAVLGGETAEALLEEAGRLVQTMRAPVEVEDLLSALARFVLVGMTPAEASGFITGANKAGMIGNASSLRVLEQVASSGRLGNDELRMLAENRL